MEVSKEALELRKFWNFYDAWFKELATNCSHREAYNRVNAKYKAVYDEDRFASFESFYETRRQRLIKNGRR